MNLISTPQAERLHIGLFGRRNSGKSSLLNALTGQKAALVSDVAGTTTDPVTKAMEIAPLGACLWIDTAGFDDDGPVGVLRVEQTRKTAEKCDIALMVCTDAPIGEELRWAAFLEEKNIPVIWVLNQTDRFADPAAVLRRIDAQTGRQAIAASAVRREGLDEIRRALAGLRPDDNAPTGITGHLVGDGDLVLLVMPQDNQAPKGRLILPQAQILRDLLDRKCIVMSCTADRMEATLQALSRPPKLIVTDSQVFRTVYDQKPQQSQLTSFSVLLARYKGDIGYYTAGAELIGSLTENSRILIAEACTHAPLSEDIGRVKLPALLRKRIGHGVRIDIVSGNDFPDDLRPYHLVIQCGACMFNRKLVTGRIDRAKKQGVPMTNYGIALAWLAGILDQVSR